MPFLHEIVVTESIEIETSPAELFSYLIGIIDDTGSQKIADHLRDLPELEQIEVLDFIEYLETKARLRKSRDETKVWPALSLKSAMRGMEEDPSDYSMDDLKEVF
jgi:hypothetical protein